MNQDCKTYDSLSDVARRLVKSQSPDVYAKLVVRGDGVDAGSDDDVRKTLASLTQGNVLRTPAASDDYTRAILAGLWLRHDFLDESHAISQELHNDTGSFWHAIMHRREGDFSNSKYWYARCRGHWVLDELSIRLGKTWYVDAFVDLVAQVHGHEDHPRRAEAVRMQRMEWAALFDYCIDAATST